MTLRKTTYITTAFFINLFAVTVLSENVFAQSVSEIQIMQTAIPAAGKKPVYQYAKENTNEIQMLLSGLFLFYKNFISSQDGSSCSFTPSCSEFGMEAVKKQGVIIGVINTFDRLTRCNSLSPEKYSFHPVTHLLYDPVL